MYGAVMATGLLTIAFAAAATMRGQRVVDLYGDLFPVLRGGGVLPQSPAAYWIFVVYVIGAAQIALVFRRRARS